MADAECDLEAVIKKRLPAASKPGTGDEVCAVHIWTAYADPDPARGWNLWDAGEVDRSIREIEGALATLREAWLALPRSVRFEIEQNASKEAAPLDPEFRTPWAPTPPAKLVEAIPAMSTALAPALRAGRRFAAKGTAPGGSDLQVAAVVQAARDVWKWRVGKSPPKTVNERPSKNGRTFGAFLRDVFESLGINKNLRRANDAWARVCGQFEAK